MSRPFTKLCDKLYETEQYDLERINIRKDINDYNISVLSAGTMIMSISFTVMIILSFLIEEFSGNRLFYIFEAVSNSALLFITRNFLKGKERPTTLGIYIFTVLVYFSGIYVDTIAQQNVCTVASCLFLGVIPLMFIDDILRIMMFSTLALLSNIALMFYIRNNYFIIANDIINSTFSWCWGIYLGIRINRIKLRSYVSERIIAIERDTDSMTGLWNKNCLTQKITDHITTENAHGLFFMMDIDHFKQLNDTFGHSYGDFILIETAKYIKQIFSENDILGRFGGDEFIFYAPDAPEEQADILAEKILTILYNNIKITGNNNGLQVSLGVAAYEYIPNMTYDHLMNMADKALYITKENGRFGYTVFSETKMERKTIAV